MDTMKRLLFPAFVIAIGAGVLAAAACDPDLTVHAVPGEGGAPAEAGPVDMPEASAPVDSGDPSETGPSEGGTEEAGAPVHVIDGTNDFTAGETFVTTSPNYTGYVSWDDTKVYFGMAGADVGGGSTQKWVLIYVDGVPGNAGTPDGIAYNCGGGATGCPPQQAHLPFNAGFHLRWKADGTYKDLEKWNGTAWATVPINTITVSQKGPFMEMSITRLVLGSPTTLKVHMTMLIEQDTATEWTYAGVPNLSFTDGPAPAAFTKYYEFDLTNTTKAPNTYATKP
jgi:hypothetical protein